jgi:hypothetical protein
MVEIAKCNGVGKQYVNRLYVWRFSHPKWWSGSWKTVNHLSLPRKHYGPAVLIFQWAGRPKSEPSDLRSRPEHAPVNSRPHWPIYKLSPPPKVQTERNLQNSRLNPNECSSPVDPERRIPANPLAGPSSAVINFSLPIKDALWNA